MKTPASFLRQWAYKPRYKICQNGESQTLDIGDIDPASII